MWQILVLSISSNSNRNSYLLTVNKIGKSFKIPPFLLLSVCVGGGELNMSLNGYPKENI